ncbi:MAG TPA: GH92 family glycosyl hydrolase [Holophagaceae bacterium]|nr:GH92 family glycosyl hydrolase [Holophagaceae bacterium]
MKRAVAILLIATLAWAGPSVVKGPTESRDYARFVNPFIGTGGHGHTFPGPTRPFGMIQPGPDTRLTGWDGCSGYHYSDDVLYGFSQTHLSGTGCSDYGDVLLLPFTGPVKWTSGYKVKGEDPDGFDPSGYGSHFRKATEKAEAGYYAVRLDDYGVRAEITTTLRAALYRWTFEKGDAQVLVDLDHRDQVLGSSLRVVDDHTIEGFRRSKAWAVDQPVYFRLVFDHAFRAEMGPDPRRKAALRFDLKPGEALLAKIAIAATDAAGAAGNLGDLRGWDFEAVRRAARADWNGELSKVEVEGGSEAQTRIFYTALYHTCLQPNLFQDRDGRYLGRDLKVHQAKPGETRYTVFSLWDTFRAAHPLYTILQPDRDQDFIRTFLQQSQEAGRLPVWELWGNETDCMIGYHAVPVIVDAWMKWLRGFDGKYALAAMVADADRDARGLKAYKALGYIPADADSESVSKTLEYSYDDWCIAQMAEDLGERATAERFQRRAHGWEHLLDEHCFMHPRADGRFLDPFDPAEVTFHFTEANAWQYSFFVPHDMRGLMARNGGPGLFEKHLDALFGAESRTRGREQVDITGLVGQYAHGNEPSHHMAYLYDYAGAPWKTQALVRRILDTMYKDDPDGLIGNEDCGQMSAWFVLSALGFYEVCPGRPDYAIGTPLFPKVTLHLKWARHFTIEAKGLESGPYIQSATLNRSSQDTSYLPYAEIMKGGALHFELGAKPSSWAGLEDKRPPSLMDGEGVTPAPVAEGPSTFTGATTAVLRPAVPSDKVFYSLDGSSPSILYTSPLTIDRDTVVTFCAEREGRRSSLVQAHFRTLDPARRLTLRTPAHPQYRAGGDRALIDGIRGGMDFRLGGWQGFYGADLDAELDLGSAKALHRLALGCLQDQNSWIFMPSSVSFSISEDGVSWKQLDPVADATDPKAEGVVIRDFELRLPAPVQARFIRVHAASPLTCPPWHKGAGQKAFIFCDELVAE